MNRGNEITTYEFHKNVISISQYVQCDHDEEEDKALNQEREYLSVFLNFLAASIEGAYADESVNAYDHVVEAICKSGLFQVENVMDSTVKGFVNFKEIIHAQKEKPERNNRPHYKRGSPIEMVQRPATRLKDTV